MGKLRAEPQLIEKMIWLGKRKKNEIKKKQKS